MAILHLVCGICGVHAHVSSHYEATAWRLTPLPARVPICPACRGNERLEPAVATAKAQARTASSGRRS